MYYIINIGNVKYSIVNRSFLIKNIYFRLSCSLMSGLNTLIRLASILYDVIRRLDLNIQVDNKVDIEGRCICRIGFL